jgi:carbon monoxide dehydrogenase subunit G
MIKISGSVCIDAPVSSVWTVLSELESIHVWADPIERSYCVGEHTRGVDAVRVCQLRGNVTVKETIVAWEEGKSFGYVAEGVPLMKRATNFWRVEERGAQTLVTASSELELKGGVFGRLLEPVLVPIVKRMVPNSLPGLKYLVENGKPYTGSTRKLLPVAASC